MSRYEDIIEEFTLSLNEAEDLSGAVGVNPSDYCHKKEGDFILLTGKEKKWRDAGCPKICEYCWNLKYNDGLYCDI